MRDIYYPILLVVTLLLIGFIACLLCSCQQKVKANVPDCKLGEFVLRNSSGWFCENYTTTKSNETTSTESNLTTLTKFNMFNITWNEAIDWNMTISSKGIVGINLSACSEVTCWCANPNNPDVIRTHAICLAKCYDCSGG